MDIIGTIVNLVSEKLGLDASMVQPVLSKLIGDGDQFDISSLLGKMSGGGLGDIAQSWLGGGANQEVGTSDLQSALGADKVETAANELGVDSSSLLGALQGALPGAVDEASNSGALPTSLSDLSGALGGLKNLF